MVKPPVTTFDDCERIDPEVRLVISYGALAARPSMYALWGLDARLAGVLRTTTDPIIGQMRFTWWHDAVGRHEQTIGEPVLQALAAANIPASASRRIIEGWEVLLDGHDEAALSQYADGRGGGLFSAAAQILRAEDPVEDAGAAWALVDLARHHSRAEVRERALALATKRIAAAPVRWSRQARPLAMLTKLVRRDLKKPEPQGSPRRIAALAMLALTGR